MTEVWKQWEGQVVDGKFHLRRYLGGSDHSAVFLTERGEPKQTVAIKLVPADPRHAEAQLARWALAAKLVHPNLIRLFEAGQCRLDTSELLYIVMEYAPENLSQILPERPLTRDEARDLLEPALDALAYLHGKHWVHGHIRPTNVMAVDDQLRLSSDGLRRMGESSEISGELGVYDPPEAAGGRMAPAGDVWSIGVLLAETLAQRVPVWERKEQGEPVLPGTLPEPFLDLARRCLRRDPQLRWTVADLAWRVQQVLPTPASQPTVKPREWLTQRRVIVTASAACLVLIAALAGHRLFKTHPAQPIASAESSQPSHASKTKRRHTASAQRTGEHASLRHVASSWASPEGRAGVKPAAGVAAQGEIVQQVVPSIPQTASDTIHGTIRVNVRVAVDPSGNVSEATFDLSGPSKYFARQAIQAARAWKFRAPKIGGHAVASEWLLRFEFKQTGPRVFPMQTTS